MLLQNVVNDLPIHNQDRVLFYPDDGGSMFLRNVGNGILPPHLGYETLLP
jgi:hypothetical protein